MQKCHLQTWHQPLDQMSLQDPYKAFQGVVHSINKLVGQLGVKVPQSNQWSVSAPNTSELRNKNGLILQRRKRANSLEQQEKKKKRSDASTTMPDAYERGGFSLTEYTSLLTATDESLRAAGTPSNLRCVNYVTANFLQL